MTEAQSPEPNSVQAAQPSPPFEIFDGDDDERLDTPLLERAFDALLEMYPEAPVAAHTPQGVMAPMPESIALKGNPVQDARSGLDLIVLDEDVFRGWERVLRRGASRYPITPVATPDRHGTVYALDLREQHGVVVTVAVFDDVTDAGEAFVAPADPPQPPPRFATIWKDQHGRIVKADEATTKMLGYDEDELVAHRSLEFIHPDDHRLAIDNWMQMLAFPGPARRVRLRHGRKSGSWVWLEVTNHNLFADPQYACAVSEMVDISEEMAAHELLDRLAKAVPVGLLQVDRDRRIAYTNDRLHEILEVERAEDFEAQLATVAESDRGVLREALAAVIDRGEEADVEVELTLPATGELRFCTIGLRPLSQEGGDTGGAIACVADITDSARMRDELERRATFDELTGCYNRAAIMRLLEQHVASGRRSSERAVMFIDVDGFKEVNDRHGHAAGDELLRDLAGGLRETLREDDIVGRMGGDEFLVVCPDVGGVENAMDAARRLVQWHPIEVRGRSIPIRVSIGVAWSQGEELDAEGLVASADHAMYECKREGRSRPVLAHEASPARAA